MQQKNMSSDEYRIPFICPHCDSDYWVIARRKRNGDAEFRCPSCSTMTALKGNFEVVGPDA